MLGISTQTISLLDCYFLAGQVATDPIVRARYLAAMQAYPSVVVPISVYHDVLRALSPAEKAAIRGRVLKGRTV